MNLEDHLRKASSDIISILTNPPKLPSMTFTTGDPVYTGLLKIAEIFITAEKIPTLPIITSTSSNSTPTALLKVQTQPDTKNLPRITTSKHLFII